MRETRLPQRRWTAQLPARPGWFEIWDGRRSVNRLVRVFRAENGELAVANTCRCRHAFYLRMWLLPCFQGTVWRGPVEVPDHLPEDVGAPGRTSSPGGSRGCLLGDHDCCGGESA